MLINTILNIPINGFDELNNVSLIIKLNKLKYNHGKSKTHFDPY